LAAKKKYFFTACADDSDNLLCSQLPTWYRLNGATLVQKCALIGGLVHPVKHTGRIQGTVAIYDNY